MSFCHEILKVKHNMGVYVINMHYIALTCAESQNYCTTEFI